METSKTLSGAHLLSCDLDSACPEVDCDALLAGYSQTLQNIPEAAEAVAHFCGLGYLEKTPPEESPE